MGVFREFELGQDIYNPYTEEKEDKWIQSYAFIDSLKPCKIGSKIKQEKNAILKEECVNFTCDKPFFLYLLFEDYIYKGAFLYDELYNNLKYNREEYELGHSTYGFTL